jgi:pyridoxamine 5'-phosphate oxidase
VDGRDTLEARYATLATEYPVGVNVPKPDFWGGYRLIPDQFEFWQGRPNRMHDRFRYQKTEAGWQIDRLMP